MKKYLFFVVLLYMGCQRPPSYTAIAEPWEPDYPIDRFESTIAEYEAEDAKQMPAPGGILLTGSSSFRLWKTAVEDLAPLPLINRGFGGSTIPEVIHYAERAIVKYRPSVVVVYCENDMFGKKPKTPEQTRDAYVALTKQLRASLPGLKMYYVSMKPSPSRWERRAESLRANALIRAFVEQDKHHEYIDVWPSMLKNGRPDSEIFISDSLHMNAEGYRRWTQVLKPILSKN
jgi:lysophospholipase L1-like esterase